VAAIVAILLAIFVLPSPWGLVAIVIGASIEIGESWFWIRFTRRRRSVTGAEGLVGQEAVVVEACRPDGRVRVHGELWRARCARGAEVGEHVRVVRVNNDLTLDVE
jgi:membrane protein implicated in regulation of membrane protease activity